MSDLSTTVAAFASSVTWSEIPDAVRETAITTLAGVLSRSATTSDVPTQLIGDATATLSYQVLSDRPSAPQYVVMDLAVASFAGLDDDVELCDELACVVVPAVYVGAQLGGSSGERLLGAVAVGLEVALRSADSLGDAHRERGWDVVGSAGRIGATVGAGITAGLNALQMRSALGFACTTASGLRIADRSIRAFGAGKAAADALEASVLADEGLIGSPLPFEGRRGLFALMSSDPHPERLVDGLGSTWLFDRPAVDSPLVESARALIVRNDLSYFVTAVDALGHLG